MSERIHELLHRNLQEVFGEGDPRRRAAIQELYTDDCADVPLGFSSGMMLRQIRRRPARDASALRLRATVLAGIA